MNRRRRDGSRPVLTISHLPYYISEKVVRFLYLYLGLIT